MTRPIPHSVEMEEAVLGAMLLSPGYAVGPVLDLLASDDFYVPAHGRVFAAICARHHAGQAIDASLVASDTGRPVDELRALAAGTPASMNVGEYARIVAEKAALRRAIQLADSLAAAAYEGDVTAIDGMLADPMARILPNFEPVAPPTEAAALAGEEHSTEYVVKGLLARLEIVLWVGEPGFGKSTLLRQMGVCMASGLHPFTRTAIPPLRVLIVDCQESRAQASHAIRPLLRLASHRYTGSLWVEPRPQGLDLTTPRHQRWLDAKVAAVSPDVVILGPLYNMVRGASGRSKQSEETAELAAATLGELMVRRNCALMVEAHAPHGDEMRVRGSKLWEDWPDFGFGLVPDANAVGRAMDVRRFRGDRHSGRDWPARYVQGGKGSWPWECSEAKLRVA